jgi:hypothetical protein
MKATKKCTKIQVGISEAKNLRSSGCDVMSFGALANVSKGPALFTFRVPQNIRHRRPEDRTLNMHRHEDFGSLLLKRKRHFFESQDLIETLYKCIFLYC